MTRGTRPVSRLELVPLSNHCLARFVRSLYLAVRERIENIVMGVRTLLPRVGLPYSIVRDLTEVEKDVGEFAEIATFASFSLAAEV